MKPYPMNVLGQVMGVGMGGCLLDMSSVRTEKEAHLTETAWIGSPSLRHRSLHVDVRSGFPAGMKV